jgi:phosphoenolpyruvate phosphomutase
MTTLILNSGRGVRMRDKSRPKCLTNIHGNETILNRQLRLLMYAGLSNIVITTGPYADMIKKTAPKARFVHNPKYKTTNYIYSIYLACELLNDDLLLLHGDLIFDENALRAVLRMEESCVIVQDLYPLPEKDFKAEIINGRVTRIGVNIFDNAMASQPLYKLKRRDWQRWLNEIIAFVKEGQITCYAENFLPSDILYPCLSTSLCHEIDTLEDLKKVNIFLGNEKI